MQVRSKISSQAEDNKIGVSCLFTKWTAVRVKTDWLSVKKMSRSLATQGINKEINKEIKKERKKELNYIKNVVSL